MYALAPLGLDGEKIPPTVETIAAKQLQIIRRVQPRGPYYLGGFCGSGPVAFELARMLKAAGERVEIVVVIESFIIECDWVVRFADRAAGALARLAGLGPAQRVRAFHVVQPWVRRAARLSDLTAREGAAALINKVRSVVATRVSALKQWCARAGDRGRPATSTTAKDDLSRAVLRHYDRAIDGFVPQTYDGHVVYVRAEASPDDSTAAWRMVAPRLREQSVKGDHNTCITTQVDSLATKLGGLLREAQDGVHPARASHATAGAPVHTDSGRSGAQTDDARAVVSRRDTTAALVSLACDASQTPVHAQTEHAEL